MQKDDKTGLLLPGRGLKLPDQRKMFSEFYSILNERQKKRIWPSISGGSAISGTYTEVFWSNKDSSGTPIDATELNTFTAEASLLGGLGRVPIVPAEFFDSDRGTGKLLHFSATGVLSTTGSPTFAWVLRLGTTSGGTLLGQTTTLTAGATVTNGVWTLDAYLQCTAIGSAGSLRTSGIVHGPTALATPFSGTIPHNSASWQCAIDTTAANSLWFAAICSASSASNKIQVKSAFLRGLN